VTHTSVTRLPGRGGSIRRRILPIALLPALLTAFGMVAHFTTRTLSQADAELQARANSAAHHLADVLPYALVAGDFARVHSQLEGEMKDNRLTSARVLDPQQRLIVGLGAPPQEADDDGRLHRRVPIVLPTANLSATLDSGVAASPLLGEVEITVSRDEIRAFRHTTLLHAAFLMVAALALSAVLAWRLSNRLAGQLGQIGDAVERLAQGDLGARARLTTAGEIGQLSRGVDRMAEALQAHRTELELRILDATADLAAKKDQAERANQAKSRFLAAASHDLRQPLHALSLFVAALKTRSREPETQTLVENIEASTAAMELLFNALLDISRLDAGAIAAHPEHIALQPLFDVLGKQFGALAGEKHLKLRIRPCNAVICSDPLLIERILANLITNAIRYTDDGGVLVGCRRRGRMLRISVIDSGRGIPPELQKSVFQEFVQLNNPARNRNKGLGLGLAIVSRLARLLGHRIDLVSRPGHGSRFSIDVPLGDPARVRASPSVSASAVTDVIPPDTLVLLVDDENAILHGMAELFDNWNIGLVTARNADEAEQWLDSLECAPDVIISDYRLPGDTDGIAAIARLREKFGPGIPAILITGDTAPESLQRIAQAGLPLLHKPLRPAKLRALLTHLVQQPRAPAVG
jgi:signal transduction histidine kinase/CheY-like chemotaxis protein